jgi:hypothetical protein
MGSFGSILRQTVFCFLFTLLGSFLLSPLAAPAQTLPYPPSPVIDNVTWDFANLMSLAPGSDLWPITWAADDNLYTSWGDGGGFGGNNSDGRVSLGFARIVGPPTGFTTANVWGGKNPENPPSFGGKSAGMLAVDGILYAWINLQNVNPPDFRLAWSSDLSATWQQVGWTFQSSNFAPSTILNFGRDYAGARDGFVYFYGGKWGQTNHMYLTRAPKAQIKERAAYEFFKGLDAQGTPVWTSDIAQLAPVFTDVNLANEFNGALKGSVSYNPGINRYLLTVAHGGTGKLGIFDAPEPWGPWTTVAYYDNWGGFGTSGEALIYVLPTKWMSADGKTVWCVFSSASHDSFNLLKATLTLKPTSDAIPPSPPLSLTVQ